MDNANIEEKIELEMDPYMSLLLDIAEVMTVTKKYLDEDELQNNLFDDC